MDRGFDLGRIDILAVGYDHLLDAIADKDVVILNVARIAGKQPDCFGSGLFPLVTANHVGDAPRDDFPQLIHRAGTNSTSGKPYRPPPCAASFADHDPPVASRR